MTNAQSIVIAPSTGNPSTPAEAFPQTADLKTAEQLLVWSVRKWVDMTLKKEESLEPLIQCFRHGKIDGAVRAFDEWMAISASMAYRPLDVRCIRCRNVGDGEIDILATIALFQAGHEDLGKLRLRTWLSEDVTILARRPVQKIAGDMTQAGLTLPLRPRYLPEPSRIKLEEDAPDFWHNHVH